MKTLESVRKSKGISKVAVARHIGVTEKTYAKYEAHPQTMSVKTANAVAGFLGVDLSDIFFLGNGK